MGWVVLCSSVSCEFTFYTLLRATHELVGTPYPSGQDAAIEVKFLRQGLAHSAVRHKVALGKFLKLSVDLKDSEADSGWTGQNGGRRPGGAAGLIQDRGG